MSVKQQITKQRIWEIHLYNILYKNCHGEFYFFKGLIYQLKENYYSSQLGFCISSPQLDVELSRACFWYQSKFLIKFQYISKSLVMHQIIISKSIYAEVFWCLHLPLYAWILITHFNIMQILNTLLSTLWQLLKCR